MRLRPSGGMPGHRNFGGQEPWTRSFGSGMSDPMLGLRGLPYASRSTALPSLAGPQHEALVFCCSSSQRSRGLQLAGRGDSSTCTAPCDNLGQGCAVELHRPHAIADLEGQLGRMVEPDMLGHLADDGRKLAGRHVRAVFVHVPQLHKNLRPGFGVGAAIQRRELAGLHLGDVIAGLHGAAVIEKHQRLFLVRRRNPSRPSMVMSAGS